MTDAPTNDELHAISDFIFERARDEAGAAGRMQSAALQVRVPAGTAGEDEIRATAGTWLEEHPPARFSDVTLQTALLALSLADSVASLLSDRERRSAARLAWHPLTTTARLWSAHPGFDPVWDPDRFRTQA